MPMHLTFFLEKHSEKFKPEQKHFLQHIKRHQTIRSVLFYFFFYFNFLHHFEDIDKLNEVLKERLLFIIFNSDNRSY